ncbi:MAG: DUF1738 domain-containing protein [Muribaculaceae bacterium]|nr:DUF1738 domain-containing protein [Muribaculaceae bacterium]
MKQEEILAKIATAIAAKAQSENRLPWVKPWNAANGYTNPDGVSYSLLNQLWLMAQTAPQGRFYTFKAAKEHDGHVRKGSKAYQIAFSSPLLIEPTPEEKRKAEEAGTEAKPKTIWLYKVYSVFAQSQIDWDKEPESQPAEPTTETQGIQQLDELMAAYIANGGPKFFVEPRNSAFYLPSRDEVHVPEKSQFAEVVEYYSTALHELAHSTGHESRLNRQKHDKWGDEKYSREELVAELTACTILTAKGFSTETSERNSVAYLQGWSRYMADKPREFVGAVAAADKAARLIMG